MSAVRIRPAEPADAPAIAAIYNHYVATSVCTFEERPVSATVIRQRLAAIRPELPWLVWAEGSEVAGYAYLSAFRPRAAYRHTAETTVYVRDGAHGRGIGRALLAALLEAAPPDRVRELIGSIALPNDSSVRLHEAFGFTQVAHLSRVGFKLGRWVDVGYWQRSLNVRSER